MDRMARKSYACSICENVNLPSVCTTCVNNRLNEKYKLLKQLRQYCDNLHKTLDAKLMAKREAAEQQNWKMVHAEKIAQLKKRVHLKESQLLQEKDKLDEKARDLSSRNSLLEAAFDELKKNQTQQLKKLYPDLICTYRLDHASTTSEIFQIQSMIIKQLCKIFPLSRVNIDGGENKDVSSSGQYDQICNARLPQGLNPHSVPPEELASSLGCMLQLLNLAVRYLSAPLLLNSGFAVSCSRVWPRASYWDGQPASRSKELPLFIPRQNCCAASEESSWTEKSASNFGVASMESPRRPYLDGVGSSSFSYGSSSPHSIETHKELQKGIRLLKKSVACVTAYCFNSFDMSVPTEMSTFEAFQKMLDFISSNKGASIPSSKEAKPRSSRQMNQPNRPVEYEPYHADSRTSSSHIGESKHTKVVMEQKADIREGSSRVTSFLYTSEVPDPGRGESLIDGWDIVEHPTLPPPPSQSEDLEHWIRAMNIGTARR